MTRLVSKLLLSKFKFRDKNNLTDNDANIQNVFQEHTGAAQTPWNTCLLLWDLKKIKPGSSLI